MIRVEHVTKRFGRHAAVEDVSLELEPGDSVALWGANGAGKTTLIRCVLGLHRFRGSISIAGHDVRRDGKQARMLVGYVPQELAFHDEMGVGEAVVFFARLKGIGHVDPTRAIRAVGLSGHESKRVRELSGGMKQRLALAIALLGDPPILILDEVTASLDAVGRREFVRLLERLSGEGRTMLFASHRPDEIGALAGSVARMDSGRITAITSKAEFLSQASSGCVLHLLMEPSARPIAVRELRAVGFDPRLNGAGILVSVHPDRKAAPFKVLAQASIPIDDFEILPVYAESAPDPTPDAVHHSHNDAEVTP